MRLECCTRAEKCSIVTEVHKLTNSSYHCYGKVKRTCEFPLPPRAVGLGLQHHSLDFAIVVFGETILLLHLAALLLQAAPTGALRFGLQRVKHRGAHQQVGEHAEDERQGPYVLLLHPRCRHEKWEAARHSYR